MKAFISRHIQIKQGKSHALEAMLDQLIAGIQNIPDNQRSLWRKHIRVIVMNCLWAERKSRLPLYYSQNKKARLYEGKLTPKLLSQAIKALAKQQCVDAAEGSPSYIFPTGRLLRLAESHQVRGKDVYRTLQHSRKSRIRAEYTLIYRLKTAGVTPQSLSRYPKEPLVILKQEEREIADFPPTEETTRREALLRDYNALLTRSDITLAEPAASEFKVSRYNRRARCVYGDNSDEGGRFYGGWWQSLPSNIRDEILIKSKPTIELDYSSLHPAILYALEGVDMHQSQHKPYDVGNYFNNHDSTQIRNLAKKVLLTAFNASSEEGCIKAVQGEINRLLTDTAKRKQYPPQVNHDLIRKLLYLLLLRPYISKIIHSPSLHNWRRDLRYKYQ